MSLLRGMNSNRAPSLIAYSQEEFVNIAHEIATAQLKMDSRNGTSVGAKLIEPETHQQDNELFDWVSYARDLDDISKMMLEVKRLTNRTMNVVLTGR